MKRILLTLTACLLFYASAFSSSPVMVLDKDNGKTVELHASQFIDIALNGNPTTGYNWYTASKFSPVLKKISGPGFKSGSERVGAGGKVTYRFKAVNIGSTLLKMEYKRSWEKIPPSKTFSIKIVVK